MTTLREVRTLVVFAVLLAACAEQIKPYFCSPEVVSYSTIAMRMYYGFVLKPNARHLKGCDQGQLRLLNWTNMTSASPCVGQLRYVSVRRILKASRLAKNGNRSSAGRNHGTGALHKDIQTEVDVKPAERTIGRGAGYQTNGSPATTIAVANRG
jgi:hypothetical protein